MNQGSGQAIPFRSVATRHLNSVGSLQFQAGQQLNYQINRQGFLSEIRLHLRLSATVATAASGGAVADPQVTMDWFPRIGLRSPQGAYLVTVSSRNLWIYNHRMEANQLDAVPVGINQAGIKRPNAVTVDPGTASVQNVDIRYRIPLGLNLGQNFETGLLLAQIANNDFTLELQCATLQSIVQGYYSGGTAPVVSAVTGTIYIETIWFELVAGQNIQQPPIQTSVKIRDTQQPALVNGDNYVSYQLGPTLLDAFHQIFTVGGNPDDTSDANYGQNIQKIDMLVNRQTVMQSRTGEAVINDMFLEFGKQFPNGVYALNFFDDYSGVNITRARDFINSQKAAQLDCVVSVGGGVSLAQNSRVVSTYREIVTLGA